jgi:hypothetical protein
MKDFRPSPVRGFTALGASALKREAEEELAGGTSAVEREVKEESALGAPGVKREAEEELALGASVVKGEVEKEFALINSAPTSVPRRHFTRAGRALLFFDRIKVNVLGRL